MYDKIIKQKEIMQKSLDKTLQSLIDVSEAISITKDANAVAIQDAKEEIAVLESFIENKANAISMLATDLSKNNESILKLKEVLNVR